MERDPYKARLVEVAETAVQKFGASSGELILLGEEQASSGIVKRQIYRVLSKDKTYILRLYRPAFSGIDSLISSRDALWSQHRWLESLWTTKGIDVPEPVRTPNGDLMVETEAPGLDEVGAERPRLALLQSSLSGVHMGTHEWDEKEVSLIGSLIARMHHSARRFQPPRGYVRPTWDWEHVFGEHINIWKYGDRYYSPSEMRVFEEAAGLAWADLAALGRGKKTFGMIHRDLHHGNFLFDEGAIRLLDFDVCGWGYYLYDLANPLFTISNLYGIGSEQTSRLHETLIDSYRKEHRLPPGFEKYMGTFLAMRRVARISKVLQDALSRKSEQMPDFMSEGVRQLQAFVDSRKKAGGFFLRGGPRFSARKVE